MRLTPEEHARSQYAATTRNLDARVAIHQFGTNLESWTQFVRARVPLASGEMVLDVGAGTGLHWLDGPPPGVELILTDRYTPMCRALTALDLGPVLQCDAEALPFEACSFGVIFSLHVLYHLTDPAAAVRRMVGLLRPGGWLALSSNGVEHMKELDALTTAQAGSRAPLHCRFSSDDVREALTACALDPVWHPYENTLEVPAAEPVMAYLDSVTGARDPSARDIVASVVEAKIAVSGAFRITIDSGLVLAQVPPSRP